MFCKFCGKEIDEDSQVCKHCGKWVGSTAVQNPDNVLKCPNCGSTNIHFITSQGGQEFKKSDACCGYLLCGPLGMLCGVKDKEPTKTVRKCMNCNHEF